MKQGFIIACTACVLLSLWLSQYIPADIFDKIVSPLLFAGTVAVAFFGAFLVFKHAEGMRMRKAWGWALLVWGIADSFYLLGWALAPSQVMDIGAHNLTTYELLIGNVLGWVLLLYPTEALRPGWISFRHVLWHLLPMFLLVALDYVFPFSLRFLITLYPIVLIAFLISHVRAYRTWCEENFSTLDDIDVQWLVRYLWMVVMVGGLYLYICLAHHPSRGFTQLWFTIFMFAYSTEQILYRKDPWAMVRRQEKSQEAAPEAGSSPEHSELRQKLDRWMEQEKPYANPAFQLADLRAVLPLNRTYLSQFVKAEYGCSFYQWVNQYRIAEAKRLKLAHPELKTDEIAARCGFSSRTVFSNVFTREEGLSPREWFKQCNPA